jgi:hypothetical protein
MNGVIIAALTGGPAAVALGVGLLRLSARLTVVQWDDGQTDHPRHAPKLPGGAR